MVTDDVNVPETFFPVVCKKNHMLKTELNLGTLYLFHL